MLLLVVIVLILITNGSSMSNQDMIAREIMDRAASEWFGEFAQIISDQPENQALIYRYFIRGLMYNYYVKYDQVYMNHYLLMHID